MNDSSDILIFDTGGGKFPTITSKAWHVLSRTNHKSAMSGYQSRGDPEICDIVNGVTKAYIKGWEEPILILLNYATLITDPKETESLVVPFEMMRHGISMDLTPSTLGGTGHICYDDTKNPMEFDVEKLFLRIEKPK